MRPMMRALAVRALDLSSGRPDKGLNGFWLKLSSSGGPFSKSSSSSFATRGRELSSSGKRSSSSDDERGENSAGWDCSFVISFGS